MKLYATITSERASKGQGGNKYLNIDILVENRNYPKYSINLTAENILITDNLKNKIIYKKDFISISKAKRQKGERCKGEASIGVRCNSLATKGDYCDYHADSYPL